MAAEVAGVAETAAPAAEGVADDVPAKGADPATGSAGLVGVTEIPGVVGMAVVPVVWVVVCRPASDVAAEFPAVYAGVVKCVPLPM